MITAQDTMMEVTEYCRLKMQSKSSMLTCLTTLNSDKKKTPIALTFL